MGCARRDSTDSIDRLTDRSPSSASAKRHHRRSAALVTTPRSALKNAHQARPFAVPRAGSTAAGVVEGGGGAAPEKKVRFFGFMGLGGCVVACLLACLPASDSCMDQG